MNLVLLEPEELSPEQTARLTGRRARHVREVHRASVGDELAVGVIGARIGKGTVISSSEGAVELSVRLEADPPPPIGVDLLLAMPRPKVLRRVLQSVASLGVKRLVLVNAFRVEKSYFDTPLLEESAVREELVLGLEQGRDTVLPGLSVERLFKPFVEDSLESLWPPTSTRRLIAHPGGGPLAREAVGAQGDRVVLAIGPEGGWIPYEVQMLESRGFARFSLGERILRTEVALPYAVGQLQLARGAAWR